MKSSLFVLFGIGIAAVAMFIYHEEALLGEQRRLVQELSARLDNASKSTSLDLQEKCAIQARKEFRQLGWDKEKTASFTNHYNDKLNKCFMLIVNNQYPWDNRNLSDAFEGTTYADYMWKADAVKKYWEVPPFVCKVTVPSGEETFCHSSDEFEELTNLYLR